MNHEIYRRQEFIGAPSSFWDTILLHIYVRDSAKKVYSCYSAGDNEGFFDNLTILIQKPISAITAIGNAFLLIRETLPVFKSTVDWIPPFAHALSGAGIFLSITQLFLETMGMQRVVSFQTQFINSPLPESRDVGDLKKWAAHTKEIAETLKRKFEHLESQKEANDPTIQEVKEAIKDLDLVIEECDSVLSGNSADIIFRASLLDIAVQKRNLKLLKKYKEQADADETIKEKLYRRLGIQFVENLSLEDLNRRINTLDDHSKTLTSLISELGKYTNDSQSEIDELVTGLCPSEYESEPIENIPTSLQETNETIEAMQIQLNKREIAHSLGSIASLLMTIGVFLSLLGMPHIGLPIMLLGSGFGMLRFLFWISYSESRGWEAEPDKWANNQILTVKEVLYAIAGWMTNRLPLEIVEVAPPEEVFIESFDFSKFESA